MGYYMENGVPYGAGITPITIEGTLVAGATSIAFTNDAILEGERYNVYAWNKPTVKPTNMVVSGHTLTLTYPAQSTDTRIKVVINENVNTMMFDDTNKADKSDLTSIFATGSTNTTGSAISAGTYFYLDNVLVRAKTSIATNATFTLNTNYEVVSAGALNELVFRYSTSEVFTGKYWIDGKKIYSKTFEGTTNSSGVSTDAGVVSSTFDTMIQIYGGLVKPFSGVGSLPVGFANISASQFFSAFVDDNRKLAIRASSHYYGKNYSITVEYIKS